MVSLSQTEQWAARAPSVNPLKPSFALARVARDYKQHPIKQVCQILALRCGAQKLRTKEYYELRLFEPKFTQAARAGFLGRKEIATLNKNINSNAAQKTLAFVENTREYTAQLKTKGVPAAQTQAAISPSQSDNTLNSVEAVQAFLQRKEIYPLLIQPPAAKHSGCAAWIEKRIGRELVMRGGAKMQVSTLAERLLTPAFQGCMLQTAPEPHPDLKQVTGASWSTIHLVTTKHGKHVTPLYAIWVVPNLRGMMSYFDPGSRCLGLICAHSGEVLRCYKGTGLDREELYNHPQTGEPLVGRALPDWNRCLEAAQKAHHLTPDLGICGFNISLTAQGPLITSATAQPNHFLYQIAASDGIAGEKHSDLWARLNSQAPLRANSASAPLQ